MPVSNSEPDPNSEQEEIEQKLIEALQSPAVPLDEDFWSEVRRIAHEQIPKQNPVRHK
jgi:hypothetical protein